MRNRPTTIRLAAVAACALALAGCSNGGETTSEPSTPAGEYAAPSSSSMSAEGEASLSTAQTELGQVVVDGKGMTIYQFDRDTQGADTSACEDDCLTAWPPVHGNADIQLDGITGEVGTITGNDGEPQLTLNGWPLYYFAQDQQAGDTTGQGVNDVWWVLDPAGEPIR